MKSDTITVSEVTTSDDSADYTLNKIVEHEEAKIGAHGPEGSFIVVSNKATLSTIPYGGTTPTNKTALDFVTRQVNPSS